MNHATASGSPGRRARRRPTLIAASAIAALALGLAACTPQDTEPEPSDISGTLTVWDWQYDSPTTGAALKAIDDAFLEAYPEVELEHVQQGFEQYDQVIQTSLLSGDVADVIMLQPGEIGVLKYADALTDLTDLVSDELRDQLVGWPLVSTGLTEDGQVFGIPVGTQTYVLYYNKQLFEQAGLDPETPPTSVEELFDVAEQLSAAGITPFGGGEAEGLLSILWFTLLWPSVGNEAEAAQLGGGELPWTDAKVAEVAQAYADLHAAGYFPSGVATTPLFSDGAGSFMAGNEAMFVGLASSDLSYVQFNEALGAENVGVVQGLGLDSGSRANYIPVGPAVGWSIPASTDNPDAALAYASFLASPEAQEIFFAEGGAVPNNVDTPLSDSVPSQPRQMLADWADNPTGNSAQTYWKTDVLVEFGKQFQLVITDQATVEAALTAIQAVQERQG